MLIHGVVPGPDTDEEDFIDLDTTDRLPPPPTSSSTGSL